MTSVSIVLEVYWGHSLRRGLASVAAANDAPAMSSCATFATRNSKPPNATSAKAIGLCGTPAPSPVCDAPIAQLEQPSPPVTDMIISRTPLLTANVEDTPRRNSKSLEPAIARPSMLKTKSPAIMSEL